MRLHHAVRSQASSIAGEGPPISPQRFSRIAGAVAAALLALGTLGSALVVSQVPAGASGPVIPAAPSGVTEVVSSSGTIDATCGSGLPAVSPFTTVQAAVSAAGPGDVIYVCAGTYNENVSIATSVTIDGAEWSVATGAGNSSARTDPSAESTVNGRIQYASGATSGTLSGLTLNGDGSNPAVTAEDTGNGWTWTNNIVDVSFGGYLLNTDGAANPPTSLIDGNRFTQATPSSADSGWSGSGVAFYGGTNSTGNNVTISNNDFVDSTGPAGAISANVFGSAAGCTATTSLPSGPTQQYFSNNLAVTGNTFEFNGSSGSNFESNPLVAMCTTNALVAHNTVTDTQANDNLESTGLYFGGGDWNTTVQFNSVLGGGTSAASGINFNTDFYPGGSGVVVTSNHVSGYLYGIHIKGSLSGFEVEDNQVDTSGAAGVQVESGDSGGTILGNGITGTVAGPGNADCVDKSSGSGTQGTANTWSSNAASTGLPTGICGPAPLEPVAPHNANEIVSATGVIDSNCGNGLPALTPFATIQAAVNAANTGDTIYVCAGSYNENVSINKPLTIDGAQWGVAAGAGLSSVRLSGAAESTINGQVSYSTGATSGTLNGLTLKGDGTNPAVTAEDVGNGWTWENNIVDVSFGGFLFNTDGAANPPASLITGNRFTQATPSSAGSGWSGSGVAFYGGTDSTGNNVTISNNDFPQSTGPAGSISANAFGSAGGCSSTTSLPSGAAQQYFSNSLSVTGNTFEFSGSSGSSFESNSLVAMCTTNAHVTGNTVTDSSPNDPLASSAFYFGGGDWNSTIANNTLNGDGASDASAINVNSDFYPAGTGIAVTGNHVSGYLYGIHVKGTLSAFSVNSNTVTTSGAAGIQVESGDANGALAGNAVSGTAPGVGNADCVDKSSGSGTSGTANSWAGNAGSTSSPSGLCGTIPAAPGGVTEVVSSTGVIDASCGSGLPALTPFTTIQAAVNAAGSGAVIYVCAGTYPESVSVTTSLTLDGAQWSVPVGAGNNAARTNSGSESIIASATGPITYGGSGLSGAVVGFTLSGRSGAGSAGISAHAAGHGYTWNNDIFTANQAGINFNTASGASASSISNDRFVNNNAPGGTQGTGIFFTNGPADNVTISGDSFQQQGHDNGDINTTGLGNCDSNADPASGSYSQNLVVTNNVAVQSSAYENNFLVLFCSNNAQVTGNSVTDTTSGDANEDTGLYVSGGNSGARITGNTLQGGGSTDASGISLNDQFYKIDPGYAASTVSNNLISGWNNGIKVVNGASGSWTGTIISGNTISHSAVDGITVGSGNTGNSLTNNAVSSSSTDDCADATSGAGTSGTGNTWSGNTGSTSAPIGLCGVAVTAVSPNGGPAAGGNTVTIAGAGFTGATAVKFGTASGTGIHVVSATSITVVAPAGTVGTVVDVVVTSPSGTSATSAADHYGYFTPPTVTRDSPYTGPLAGGTLVTVTGTGFGGTTRVNFGATAAPSFTVVSATTITATSPAEAAGTVNLTVTNPAGTSPVVAAGYFTYYAPVPTVSSISPNAGAAGTSVLITGTGFTGATSVSFGGINSSGVSVTSNTSITAIAPAGVAKSVVDVTVTGPGGTSALISSDKFTYGPLVTSVSPNAGNHLGGTTVTIKGAGFTGATAVRFGATAVTSAITVNAAGTQITVSAPAHVAGAVDITVTVGATTTNSSSMDVFTYV